MNTLDIGIEVDIRKLLTTKLLVQAGSGGGKSWCLRKIIESVGDRVQQVIIDPEGEFVTLREKFDFLLISKDGDIPLSLKYAETIATKLLDTGVSAIIDLYELKEHERIEFVDRFLKATINAPKDLWHSVLYYVDEAHIFCPENEKGSMSRGSVIDLCTRGRKRGFSVCLATQRLSLLNKSAVAQCQNKLLGLTVLDIDRKRTGEELGFSAKSDLLKLRQLEPGEFYAFGPAISREVKKFKVGPVQTTHLDSGQQMPAAPATPQAIKKILARLGDIQEEAEKEFVTKQDLQKEVTRLRGQLTRLSNTTSGTTIDSKELHEMKAQLANANADSKKIRALLKDQQSFVEQVIQTVSGLNAAAQEIHSAISLLTETTPAGQDNQKRNGRDALVVGNEKSINIHKGNPTQATPTLEKCPLAILRFLASYTDKSFSRVQVAAGSGYSHKSSGFENGVSRLNTLGLIIKEGQRLRVNPESDWFSYTGTFEPLNYDATTFYKVLEKCPLEVYGVLLKNPNNWFDKQQLAAATPSNYSPTSSGFENAISRLNVLELIEKASGKIRLNPDLQHIY